MIRPLTSPRRGYSLIEMLAVIICLTMLLGVGTATLQGLVRLDRSARAVREENRIVDRLAQTFRADVHRAYQRGAGPDQTLVLRLRPDETVEYRADGASVLVTRRRGDEPPRTERFRLPSRGSPRLAWVEYDGRTFARLQWPGTGSGRGGLRIEAALRLGLREGDEEVER
jgi:type II secretory pathway pseudopilin PulG